MGPLRPPGLDKKPDDEPPRHQYPYYPGVPYHPGPEAVRPEDRSHHVWEELLRSETFSCAQLPLGGQTLLCPPPVEDWRAGNIQKQNTEREEAYIQAVLRICEEEKIDTIFPSYDPQVYVFSKNKERFERMGVVIPIPDYETVITPLDKYRTILAAQEVGFPLVIKPRFTSASWGIEMVDDFSGLSEKTRLIEENHSMPMIQEHIPGKEKRHFDLMLDKKGELKAIFC